MKTVLVSLSLTLLWGGLCAQKLQPLVAPDSASFTIVRQEGSPLTIDLEAMEDADDKILAEAKEDNAPKRKRNTYWDIKTRKGYTRSGYGQNQVVELFYYIKKDPPKPDDKVPEIYWLEMPERKIRINNYDPTRGYLLHGPYTKKRDGEVVEEGVFFQGTKHGRWRQWNTRNILISKRKYTKGWPRGAQMSYYGVEQDQLKEVVPYYDGEKHGEYYLFYETGDPAVLGQYEYGQRVGNWTSYYPFRKRRKKVISYPRPDRGEDFEPYISREWDSRGRLVYERDTPWP